MTSSIHLKITYVARLVPALLGNRSFSDEGSGDSGDGHRTYADAGIALPDAPVSRVLLYCPDALGCKIFGMHPDLKARVESRLHNVLSVNSVIPPVTPVVFASMFSGLEPDGHGIRKYEKPVLKCPTLFDILSSAGFKTAIVAVADSSVDTIFAGRDVDYYSETYDPEVTRRTLSILKEDRYDLIVAYHQAYDDCLHKGTPFDNDATRAFQDHISSFEELYAAARTSWAGLPHAIGFLPDHGAHVDEITGKGTHGLDMSDDTDVFHFWGFFGQKSGAVESSG